MARRIMVGQVCQLEVAASLTARVHERLAQEEVAQKSKRSACDARAACGNSYYASDVP